MHHHAGGRREASFTAPGGSGGAPPPTAPYPPHPLLSPEACELLDTTPELDYLTHIVFRMYENKAVPVHAPGGLRL